MADKLIRDGKVAVLYSPGFGAGWYSWNSEHPDCIFDKEICEAVEAGKDVSDIAQRKYGRHFYTGGGGSLTIEWVDQGAQFQIDEYDGNESIHIIGEQSYHTA